MRALILIAWLAPIIAHADGSVRGTVKVNRPKDAPAGAVLVYIVGFEEKPPAAAIEVKQQSKRFVPDLVAVTAGGTIKFPNNDPFMHNVFSATSDRTFDLGSYGKGEARNRTFPKRGVIDIYCNIHPEMSATLVVLPNTKYTFTDASGHFQIDKVPPGKWAVFAFTRRAVRPTSAYVTVGTTGTADVDLELEEATRDFQHKNKFGEAYRPTTIYP